MSQQQRTSHGRSTLNPLPSSHRVSRTLDPARLANTAGSRGGTAPLPPKTTHRLYRVFLRPETTATPGGQRDGEEEADGAGLDAQSELPGSLPGPAQPIWSAGRRDP